MNNYPFSNIPFANQYQPNFGYPQPTSFFGGYNPNVNPGVNYRALPEIRDWSFVFDLENKFNPRSLSIYITGNVVGGEKMSSGEPVVTSKIKRIDLETSLVETDSGNLYQLGRMNKKSERYYNDALQIAMNKGLVKE